MILERVVEPDGDAATAQFAIVGEAPAREEVARRKGFVGPSGKLIWPVLRRLAGLDRSDCWVTNLCKRPLDNDTDGDSKLEPEEFEAWRADLLRELRGLPHLTSVLAVGTLAGKALLGERAWHSMPVNNGMSYGSAYGTAWRTVPCWHPAAALRGAGDGKDPLAWMGDAMSHFRIDKARWMSVLSVPDWVEYDGFANGVYHLVPHGSVVGVDTEGLPSSPECLTFATDEARVFVPPERVHVVMTALRMLNVTLAFHNAPWDWTVIEAMGYPEPWKLPFVDTMELAYLRQTEPQGLKDLGRRHFGIDMQSWEQVVMPRYGEIVGAAVEGRVAAGTKITTHSPKTGKAYKIPKVERNEDAKRLYKLRDPLKMAAAIGFEAPSLKHCPWEEFAEYATLDPFVTRALVKRLK